MVRVPFPLLVFLLFSAAVYACVVPYLRREGYPRSAALVGSVYLTALGLVLYTLYR